MGDALWTIAEEPEGLVYVPDADDGYKLGRIRDIGTDVMLIELEGSKQLIKVSYEKVLSADDDPGKSVDDNCALIHLNEATLLNNCRVRYEHGRIYTYIGSMLVSVNPYEQMPDLYSDETMRSYVGKSLGAMPPHVFAIADKAYRDMRRSNQSQSIVVSGESGAGKTETQKCVLRYLCHCCGSSAAGYIEKRLIETNIILDAFGNAKTLRNNNSSRFGKFIQIHFDEDHQIVGGFVSHYLLEKTRVCFRLAGERNFHIFHQLIASSDIADELELGRPYDYQYLRDGCCQTLVHSGNVDFAPFGDVIVDEMVDDVADFGHLLKALLGVGFNVDERRDLLKLLGGILHLGNVDFDDQVDDFRGGTRVTPTTEKTLFLAAELLGLDANQLRLGLTARMMQPTRGGMKGTLIMVPLHRRECIAARDALAKALYTRLFDVVIAHINESIPFDASANTHFIGILDIAGFEFFDINSFEQFCINYCNEKLQQFFNDRILRQEQNLYEEEGLKVSRIDYYDNSDCIELFEQKQIGLLELLDEEARLPKSSAQHFTLMAKQMNQKNSCIDSTRKSTTRRHRELREDEGFLIRHYAAPVCYETASFLEKNNDALHDSLEMLLQESDNALMKQICAMGGNVRSHSSSTQLCLSGKAFSSRKLNVASVGCKFRNQLTQLIEKLGNTNTHFIRCLKPNSNMAASEFTGKEVLGQLKCAGMDSVLKLMQKGFPSRTSFAELYRMYESQLPPRLSDLDPHLFCRCLFHALGLSDTDYRFGTTKVFFRAGKFAEFDQVMKQDAESMRMLIEQVRFWIHRLRWRRLQSGVRCCIRLKNIVKEKKREEEQKRRKAEEWERHSETKRLERQLKTEEEACRLTEEASYREKELTRQEEVKNLTENHVEDEELVVRRQECVKFLLEKYGRSENSPSLDLTSWTFDRLREVINTTEDIHLRVACATECRRRLSTYQKWKAANNAAKH